MVGLACHPSLEEALERRALLDRRPCRLADQLAHHRWAVAGDVAQAVLVGAGVLEGNQADVAPELAGAGKRVMSSTHATKVSAVRITDETPEEFAALVYAVKFNFMSGSPGYVGDLYILQGDYLTGDQPLVFTREDGKLVLQASN